MTSKERFRQIIRAWQGKRVLVLGDVLVDEYVIGRPLGVAREAPVLQLQHLETRLFPGGATNVASNVVSLGASVQVCGVVGDDETGRNLTSMLEAMGMDCAGVSVDPTRPTTTKTRIAAGGAQQQIQQMVLRLDRVDRRPVAEAATSQMAGYVAEALRGIDALMVSDYENGVIHPGLIEASLPRAFALDRLVAVDSHGDLFRFKGAALFTPNQPEAEATLGRRFADLPDLERAGNELVRGLLAQGVLITRGQEGMSLFEAEAAARHLPASETTAVDPTGAGDTVAAAFTLAVAAGATLVEAAELSNIAAAVVVARVGTATASAQDLLDALEGGGS